MSFVVNTPEEYELLSKVGAELYRQFEKWGQQNHPWRSDEWRDDSEFMTPTESWWGDHVRDMSASAAQQLVDDWTEAGIVAYSDILMEEVVEALDESDPDKAVTELIQIAAVAVAAAASLQRNGR